jgi:hypothetical protein
MNEVQSPRRRPDGIVILVIWYIVLAGGVGLAACAATVPAVLISFNEQMAVGGRVLLSTLLGFGAFVALASAAILAIVAWGLWRQREWARIGAMLVAVLHLPFFPVGSAIGVATLWYLSSHPDARDAFSS